MTEENEKEILDSVAGNMSEINPDVIEQDNAAPLPPQEEPTTTAAEPVKRQAGEILDRYGRPFDPALHVVNDDGSPRINKKDGYLTIKPGRPGAFKEAREERTGAKRPEPATATEAQALPQPASELHRKNTARILTVLFIKLGIGMFGEEWYPKKEKGIDEESDLVTLWDAYLESKGMSDIPPGAALALGLCGYAACRLHLPQTRSRFGLVLDYAGRAVKKFVGNVFGWIKKLLKGQAKNASHFDLGNDGNRQDNAGQAPSGPLPTEGHAGAGA